MPQPKWPLFQLVYLRADTDKAGCVTGYVVRPAGGLLYLITWNDAEESPHWEAELLDEKPL